MTRNHITASLEPDCEIHRARFFSFHTPAYNVVYKKTSDDSHNETPFRPLPSRPGHTLQPDCQLGRGSWSTL